MVSKLLLPLKLFGQIHPNLGNNVQYALLKVLVL